MSVTSADLLAWAQASTCPSEVETRAVISRAYYAAYHRCKEWHQRLPAPGFNSGPSGGVHQQLLNQLRNPAPQCSPAQASLSRQLSYALQDLKGHRFTADYELVKLVAGADAALACTKAAGILAKAV